jgi:hypothetical protein
VGRAVEAGDVSANLLNELITEVQVSRDKSQRESHTAAVQSIASEVGLSSEEVETGLAALEAKPRVIREAMMRRVASAWLEAQRKAY